MPSHTLPLIAFMVLLIGLPVLLILVWFKEWGRRKKKYAAILQATTSTLGFQLSTWATENRALRDANFAAVKTLAFQPLWQDTGSYMGYEVVRLSRTDRFGPQLLRVYLENQMARFKLPWEIPTVVVVTLTGQLVGTPRGRFHLRRPHSVFGSNNQKGTLAYQLKPKGTSSSELNELVNNQGIRTWFEKFPIPVIVLYQDGFLTLALEEPNQSEPPASFTADVHALIEGFDTCSELLGANR